AARELGEGQDLLAGGVEVGVDLGEPDDVVEEPVVLGVHRGGVDLVEHRVQHRLDPAPGVLATHSQQVHGVVGATPLPAGAGQVRPDRADQAGVRVGGDQCNPRHAAGDAIPA